jgi:S-methylmethionine-dependent homocysteine/selenocysteine methylase
MSPARPSEKTPFAARLAAGPRLLLDGALGTELERRGVACRLPLWSAHALLEAPALVEAIHREYAQAGADILTSNTFRTQRRTLARAGLGGRAAELCRTAVELARAGAGDRAVFVAGSAPPLEDCYRPDLVPDDATCEREHREHAENLARAGVDLIAVETMNSVREARRAAAAARATGLPFFVSFVCDDRACLLSGEPLAAAVAALRGSGTSAVGVNCAPPETIDACLAALVAARTPADPVLCIYPNLGAPRADGSSRTHDCTPAELAARAAAWIRAGVRILGGCCGTRPEHVAALAMALGRKSGSGSP